MNSLPDEILSRILFLAATTDNSQVDAAASDAGPSVESDVSPCHGLGMVSKRWASLLPVVRINAPADSPPRREEYYRYYESGFIQYTDKNLLPVPKLSTPALLRTLSRAPSVTSLTLGDGAVDFYDDSFLTSLLAASPKLTCLTLGEPRFTDAPPPFTISFASLNSFFRAAAPQLQELALLLPYEARKHLDSISSLSSLRVLRLHSNTIQQLPDGLCHLPALQELQFSCSMLWDVPEDFGQLKALTRLSIVDSQNGAHSLPDSLGDLSSLTSLCIAFPCGRLPSSVTALHQLRRLQLRRYDSDFPDGCEAWTRLEEVSLEKCSVRSFPPAWLKTLKRLTVRSCQNMEALPLDAVVRGSPLRHLTFEGGLHPLPLHPLSQLSSLQRLKVSVQDLFWRFTTGDEDFPMGLLALPSLSHVSVDRVAWVEQGNAPKGSLLAYLPLALASETAAAADASAAAAAAAAAPPAAAALAAAAASAAAAFATAAAAAAAAATAAATAAAQAECSFLGPSLQHLELSLALESLELKERVSDKEAASYRSMLARMARGEEPQPERHGSAAAPRGATSTGMFGTQDSA
ncbi:unnamed protein product [Closterium sp. Naga37s-1]|nr:unnamed protein product [Closterium sp. Naga37s-1]